MGVLLIEIPLILISALVYFILSPTSAGWLVLVYMGIWNIFTLIKSFSVYKRFSGGESIKEAEIVAMASQPFTSSVMLIAIISLLFIDISKLHLIWFYPLASIIFEFTIGTRAVRKLDSLAEDGAIKETNMLEMDRNAENDKY